MHAIINTKLILEDGIIFDGVLLHENGRIVKLGKSEDVEIPADAAVLDAKGLYTAPGFIDIHCHGSDKELFHVDPQKCVEHFIQHGTTTVLPTFYCTLSLEEMLEGAKKIREVKKNGIGKIIYGLYMEGPYMSGGGSNQKYIRWTGDIRREEYEPLINELKDDAKIWAVDPGRPGIEGFIKDVLALNPNAVMAMGHSTASFDDCAKLRKYNLNLQTHHGDSGKHAGTAQSTMGAGCDEYTLYDPTVYAELICDQNAVHVQPGLIKMVVRTKGVEKMILITDCMPTNGNFTNNEADGVAYGPDLNYDYEGHLAGSHLTMENACRNMMTHTGYGLCHAIRFATANPARMLGIDNEVGSLEVGKKANLLLIDDMVNINKVILEGECVVG